MTVPPALPSLFISHGSPMHALLDTRATRLWRALGERLAGHAPRAVLIGSAHWETGAPQLSAAAAPATIQDFGGFPEPLNQLRYAAPGAPAIAERAAALLEAAGLPASLAPTRGLDHGAWVPLRHLFPAATIPVLQLSVQPHRPAALAAWESAPHAQRAHPTPEHFLPLLIAWSAAGPGARAEHLPAGVDAGVLASDAWLLHPDPAHALRH